MYVYEYIFLVDLIQRTVEWAQVCNNVSMFQPMSQIGAETRSYRL